MSIAVRLFSYILLDIITKENKDKHRKPLVVPYITDCSGSMSLSHSDCPLVVSCVSHTWTRLCTRTTISTCFALHTSYVTFSKGHILRLTLKNNNIRQKAGDFPVVHWSAQLAKSQLQWLPSLLDVLHHISKDRSSFCGVSLVERSSKQCREGKVNLKEDGFSFSFSGKLYLVFFSHILEELKSFWNPLSLMGVKKKRFSWGVKWLFFSPLHRSFMKDNCFCCIIFYNKKRCIG